MWLPISNTARRLEAREFSKPPQTIHSYTYTYVLPDKRLSTTTLNLNFNLKCINTTFNICNSTINITTCHSVYNHKYRAIGSYFLLYIHNVTAIWNKTLHYSLAPSTDIYLFIYMYVYRNCVCLRVVWQQFRSNSVQALRFVETLCTKYFAIWCLSNKLLAV